MDITMPQGTLHFKVGNGKNGVGRGVFALFSPALNEQENSLVGTRHLNFSQRKRDSQFFNA